GGEQRDLMATANERLGEPGYDTFRAPVELRRHALVKRCDLSNAHGAASALFIVVGAVNGPALRAVTRHRAPARDPVKAAQYARMRRTAQPVGHVEAPAGTNLVPVTSLAPCASASDAANCSLLIVAARLPHGSTHFVFSSVM